MVDRELKSICRRASSHIRSQIFPGIYGAESPAIEVRPYGVAHGSGARILRADEPRALFIKYDPAGAGQEMSGYELLKASPEFAPHLVDPLSAGIETPFWVVPFIESDTLHNLVCYSRHELFSREYLQVVFAHFLEAEAALWTGTQESVPADLVRLYTARVQGTDRIRILEENIQRACGVPDFANVSVVVNGYNYGSISNMFSYFTAKIRELAAPRGCTIHGDDQPQNIIIPFMSGKKNSHDWNVVDYVTAHHGGDWMVAVAKMLHWWDFYCVIEMASNSPTMTKQLMSNVIYDVDASSLLLSYNDTYLKQARPALTIALRDSLLAFIGEVANILEPDPSAWRERLSLAMFAVAFGSAYRHSGRLSFGLPILLGMSLEYLAGGENFELR